MGAGFGILSMVVLGFSGALCEYAAYDCLICPYCGQRAVKSHREFPGDKENNARFKAIVKGRGMTPRCLCFCNSVHDPRKH